MKKKPERIPPVRLTVGELRRFIKEVPDDVEIDFGCTLDAVPLIWYRFKWRDDKLLQLELNEDRDD